jgi:hypothetical protein
MAPAGVLDDVDGSHRRHVAPIRPSTIRLSRLDIIVNRHAHAHNHGSHASPIVGCYLCLHGVRLDSTVRELRIAA